MNEDLREPDAVGELEDRSDGQILKYIFRILQFTSGIGGAWQAIRSISEKGYTADALPWTIIGIGAPIILELLIHKNNQSSKELYDAEPGVVEE